MHREEETIEDMERHHMEDNKGTESHKDEMMLSVAVPHFEPQFSKALTLMHLAEDFSD